MTRFFTLIIITLLLASCGSGDPMPDRPGHGNGSEAETPYDYTPHLADATVRAEAPGLTLKAGDAGVLYIADTPAGSYSYIDVDRSRRIDFDINPPALKVDGTKQAVSSCTRLKQSGRVAWYGLTVEGAERPAIVVVED